MHSSLVQCLNDAENVKVFKQQKALIGVFSVIVKTPWAVDLRFQL